MSKDTGKAKRPKRDPNQPLEKPKKRRFLLVKLAVAGLMILNTTWMSLYSFDIGRGPWAWSREDWTGFVTFSKQQASDASEAVRAQVAEIDWKELWDRATALEDQLEEKLAELRGKRQQPNATAPAGATATEARPEGEEAAPAAIPAPEPSAYEQGLEAMREGIRHYKKSNDSQAELKKAKASFRAAYDHFEAAIAEAQDRNDEQRAVEVEGYLQQCNLYLEDCSKREILDLR